MNSNSAEKLLPIFTDEQKLEVSLENGKAVLQLSTWTADLGWCGQKTLPIDIEMLDDLHRAIAAARYKVNKGRTQNSSTESKILEFPKFN